MRKGEKRLFLGVLALLLGALLLLLVQWAQGGNIAKVYHVSVLLDGSDNDYWKNLRAGMNQAALEQNIDLRFITKYDGDTTQAGTLRAEWEGEADGVVLVPVDAAGLSETLKNAPSGLVVGVVGPRLDTERVDCYIAPDYAQVGRRLAEAAMQAGAADGCTVYLSPKASSAAEQIAAALETELREMGVRCIITVAEPGATLAPLPKGVLVAAEPAMTEALCAAAEGSGRVVGAGASSRLLHYLEDGTAAALVVQSDYDAGYLAISQVARRLAGGKGRESELETYTANAENMFKDPLIDILFATY